MVWILVVLMVTLLLLVGAFRFVYVPWSHDVHRPPAPSVSSLTTDEAGALNEESQQQQHAPVGERRNAMLSILFGTGKWEDLNSLEIDNTAAEDAVHSLLTATNEDINKMTRQGAAKTNQDDDDGNHDTIGSGPCTRSCRFILQEYDDRGSFFICVDFVMTAACGGIQGASVAWTASYENCSSLLYGALGVLGVYWLIAVLRRPFRYGYVSVLNVLLTSLEIASVGWELYRTRHPIGYEESINRNGEGSMNTISNSIVYAGITLVGLKLLLDILVGWYGVYRCCFTKRSDHGRGELRRRLQQRRREIARVRAAKDAREMKEFLRTTHMVDDELIGLADALTSSFSSPVDEDQQREWL
ncbi:unnamed protein product [Bodo saltans]|uniref:Membrane-associated protein n=1 Tax=Bodo saltans TaxID=75058 RepID=A0A0S4J0S2_BODSA|nr:unnamed protein product [Bodo saltans]|eukprot:CUG35563.1 unnamed protein product [Bodo saltans]